MKYRSHDQRKAYVTQRMLTAIERAIKANTHAQKEGAARWAAAWGALAGIRTPGLRLRRDADLADIADGLRCARFRRSPLAFVATR
jgi:hypothetical protein